MCPPSEMLFEAHLLLSDHEPSAEAVVVEDRQVLCAYN